MCIRDRPAWSRARVVAVAAGEMHSLFVCADGAVLSCGNGEYGRLGHGDERDQLVPRAVGGALHGERVCSAAAGSAHSVAVLADGRLFAWGARSGGRLGLGEPSATDQLGELATGVQLTPALVRALADARERIVAASAGEFHQLALTARGEVYAWGVGLCGRLGHGEHASVWAPRRVDALAHARVVARAVSAGGSHSLVVAADGRLYAFGDGRCGQLGSGREDDEALPIEVLPALPHAIEPRAPARWPSAVLRASAGRYHSLALTADGRAWAWGLGAHGQLGLGDEESRLAPCPLDALAARGVRVRGVSAGARRSFLWAAHSHAVYQAGFVRGGRAVADLQGHDGELWDSLRVPTLVAGLHLARPGDDDDDDHHPADDSLSACVPPAARARDASRGSRASTVARAGQAALGASAREREHSGHMRVPGLVGF